MGRNFPHKTKFFLLLSTKFENSKLFDVLEEHDNTRYATK